MRQVYVLTQFNSASLNRHISRAYKFDLFSRGFVEILAAQQTPRASELVSGHGRRRAAEPARLHPGQVRVLPHPERRPALPHGLPRGAGKHIEHKADITIATIPVDGERAQSFGIMQTDASGASGTSWRSRRIPPCSSALAMPVRDREGTRPARENEPSFEASMGIYVFNRDVLIEALDNDFADFGKHIIPAAIKKYRVQSYPFQGYWEDIGTIRSFFEANLDLCAVVPEFDFFDSQAPIYTHARFLPATKINGGSIHQALISDGCILTDAHIETASSASAPSSRPRRPSAQCIIMGADYYAGAANCPADRPPPGIGKNCRIERAIIDKNVHIGDGVVITPKGKTGTSTGPTASTTSATASS